MLLEQLGRLLKPLCTPVSPTVSHSSFPSCTHSTKHLSGSAVRPHTLSSEFQHAEESATPGWTIHVQTAALFQGDPKTTAGVPFIPTPFKDGCSVRLEGGSQCSGSHCDYYLGSPEEFRHPFPENTWMRHKTQKQRATGSAKKSHVSVPLLLHPASRQAPKALVKRFFSYWF